MKHIKLATGYILGITLFIITLWLTACGGNGSTIANNPSVGAGEPAKITIGKLAADKSLITMNVAVFGDSDDDVDGATIDVKITHENSTTGFNGLKAITFFVASASEVRFELSNLSAGAIITFTIHKTDSAQIVYTGEVSATQDTEASSTAEVSASDSSGISQACIDNADDILSSFECFKRGPTGEALKLEIWFIPGSSACTSGDNHGLMAFEQQTADDDDTNDGCYQIVSCSGNELVIDGPISGIIKLGTNSIDFELDGTEDSFGFLTYTGSNSCPLKNE